MRAIYDNLDSLFRTTAIRAKIRPIKIKNNSRALSPGKSISIGNDKQEKIIEVTPNLSLFI
ncbi:MAG: hypothetical protein PHU49_07945 [Syntrophorhabdaceae bacterium]|nr:hypothetical protein [Syntrophorhabdaceae bacterium]MDD5243935.1 hypothetical protein [Syntrophorhabdaceae bacterium]